MKYDKFSVAQVNKSKVFDLIRKQGPISRVEISRCIGLSIPTVMKITDEFVQKRFVHDIGKGESSGGKRPELLEVTPDSKFIIGVGIGRSKTNVLIMNLMGQVVFKETMITGDTLDSGRWIARLIEVIEVLIRRSGLEQEQFLGMGIGMPGILEEGTGKVLFSPDFKWENVDIATPVKRTFQMDITIENANRALAMGEYFYGAGTNSKNFIVVNLGHGIGSAIMQEGELFRGSSGSSGEIGHIVLEKDGPRCNCGNRGCLEAIASGNAIARDAKIAVLQGEQTVLSEITDLNRIDAKEVFRAAQGGDRLSEKIVERAIQYVGIGLANYINLFDPDLIILSGGLMNAGDLFFNGIKDVLRERQMRFAVRQVRLEVSQMGENGTAIGSASTVLKNFIKYGE